ncbi:hypothetical protein PYW07_005085 [Mythimna separata]|uniref:RNA-directed DNA polymerase n=1 Tax=Mythimna separata TaxID=271217 RepID=A0AAD7YE74_MYTSE|nr:hypothetical protein PYW07_005085 [Mythimna separata]
MVLTRSRANSLCRSASTANANHTEMISPPTSELDLSPPGAAAAMLESMQVPLAGNAAATAERLFEHPSAPAPLPAPAPTPAPAGSVTLTNEQFELLMSRFLRDPVSTPSYSGNFAKCTSRFDGDKSSDVRTFIDAIVTYKECVSMEDHIALRGLPILLTDLAAKWWLGVKATVHSWKDALDLLLQTFGPRLPPHKLYRQIFSREQGNNESTDAFVCHLRSLFARLPPNSLSEEVQLDMTYGLLLRRIREKVPRTTFCTFGELLTEARRVEDLTDESRQVASNRPSISSAPTVNTVQSTPPTATVPTTTVPVESKRRHHCTYCKQFGHLKDNCRRLAARQTTAPTTDEDRRPGPSGITPPSITCFGCGTPGVVRSKCPKCTSVVPKSENVSLQSVNSHQVIDSRVRPIVDVNICGVQGKFLLDTGARHSVGSVSLRKVLDSNGFHYDNVFLELKFADGRISAQYVDVAVVNVTALGMTLPVKFVMLPNSTESLLGMNFIQDIGMIIDFSSGTYSTKGNRTPIPLNCEGCSQPQQLCSSSVGLRNDEGARLEPDHRDRLSNLLMVNEDIFKPGGGPTSFAVHRIDTGDAVPISSPPYRVSPAKKEIIRQQLDKMLEEEVIEEAESEWASPVVLVPKKNGEVRFCVDYRKLNSVTRADKYPLPVIDELLQSTKPNSVMSTIDLKAGYWQINVAPEDRPKTSFITPFGTLQFRRMPFGLRNAPSTFQRLIDRFRSGLKDVCVLAYLDDLLVISSDPLSHVQDLQQVFDRLRLFNLTANRVKCVFARDTVTYLGHVISARGIEPDPMKVDAVMKMEPPSNLKQLKTFLQTCSWFRKFIPNFSEVGRSLTSLTKKTARWHWGETEQQAFEDLKSRLSTSPILIQPDFEEPFILRTDASGYALGAVLLQGPTPQEERPIEYASRLLLPAERNYHTTEREALAVVWALDKFRGYVEGAKVRVATDHQPLKWLLSLKTPSGRLARWAMKLQSFNLDIEYTPGKINVVADTMSRPVVDDLKREVDGDACSICPVVIDLPRRGPNEVRTAQLDDPEVCKIIRDFEDVASPDAAVRWADRGYYLTQGVLYRSDPDTESEEPQLVIPESLRAELMKELHDAPTAGHLGLERTLQKIKERYYFKNMRAYVANYIKSCEKCQKYKATNLKPAGLLQTPVQQQRFEVLAMDLFGPLPAGPNGEKWVFLVEDTASRWVEVFAMQDSTSESCARVLVEEVFMRYGVPRRIISDNGSQFVSAVMQKALFVLGVSQSLIPVYHPEANPAERKNRELKQLLAILVEEEHSRWPVVLPMVRFAINSAHNQGTGHTAAFLTFGRELRSPMAVHTDLRGIISQENFVPQITPYLDQFSRVLQDVKRHVEEQQDKRKEVGDKKRRHVVAFKVGDPVLVETHFLSNSNKGFTSKFAPRREGPYEIKEVVSPTSYVVSDSKGVIKGKYHANALTPYTGSSPVIAHQRRRGRPAKSRPSRSCDLEGEGIANESVVPTNIPMQTGLGRLRRSERQRRAPAHHAIYTRASV